MTNRTNDEKVIIYLTNRKIASNMKNDNSLKMKRIRQLFLSDKITFDDAVKAIANDSFIIFDDAVTNF